MSAPTAEVAPPAVRPRPHSGAPPRVTTRPGGSLYLWLALAALVIAALSLQIPSTPSYDPWAWLVWGREIVHLNLQTTGGPSWKPLPMLFTTVFALFGGAAPDLWLVLARAGALAALAMSFRIAWRLTSDLIGEPDRPSGRLRQLAPLLAGVIAAGTLVNTPGFITDNALGYSEGLATALALIAVDRYLDGAPRQTFVVGFFAALDRPELWVFWVPYGLFLMRRDPGTRRFVPILFALIPVLWFGPELWGSGHLLRNVTRALHPRANSAAFAKCPVCTVFRSEAWPQVPDRIKVPGFLGLLLAAVGLWRTRGSRWRGRRPIRARAWLAGLLIFGYIWWLGIAIETQAGFSGNNRYLVLGTAPIAIAGGVSWGWFVDLVATRVRRLGLRSRRLRRATDPRVGISAGALLAIALLVAIPPWIGKSIVSVPRVHGALVYQAHLRQDMAAVVKRFGSRQLLACGSVMTEGFQVPMLAYMLDVPTLRVEEPPAVAGTGPPPNVILQTRAQRNAFLLPIIRPWHVHYAFVDHQRTFRVFMNCSKKLST